MYMNITVFRGQLSECFDRALSGQPVIVHRGGVVYRLTADVMANKECEHGHLRGYCLTVNCENSELQNPSKLSGVITQSTPKGKNQFASLLEKNSEPEASSEDITNLFVEPDGAPNRHHAGKHCCTLNKPCQHWGWDNDQLAWVNELTGETRDVELV